MKIDLSPKTALALFVFLVLFIMAQAVWWVVFMAQLADEKVELAQQLDAQPRIVDELHQEEVSRQVMLGMEGVVFLLLLLVGIWLIYRALVRTEQLKTRQQNFLMAVTHELKTPLASIKLYLDSLQSQKIPEEKKRSVVPRMKQDVMRLEQMVENMLDVGRFERKAFRLHFHRTNLSSLVNSVIDAVGELPTKIPPEIKRDIETGLFVQGDSAALRRALHAVLDNSLKYNDGLQISIRVSLHASDGKAVITVTDKGIGLEKKELEAVFDRFYRVGNEMTRTSQGTGLGLYLGREMIRLHKGKITASSDGLGRGAQFVITLPRELFHEDNSAG
jgi:signal transduction histidine kinase